MGCVVRAHVARFDGGHVYRAKLRISDVIAYDDERNEKEVLQYGDVYDVEEIASALPAREAS